LHSLQQLFDRSNGGTNNRNCERQNAWGVRTPKFDQGVRTPKFVLLAGQNVEKLIKVFTATLPDRAPACQT